MKRLLLLLLLAFVVWKGYERVRGAEPTSQPDVAAAGMPTAARLDDRTAAPPSFQCDGRVHCSQMNSRAEAEFFTRHCPDTKMDGDRDGEPCENDTRF